jgi:type II secretory pathway pseudopilin PulG
VKLLRRIDPADVVIEVFSIVLAILLALAVNSWQERVRTDNEVKTLLANVRDEIAQNRTLLVSEREHHLAVYHTFEALSAHQHVVTLDEFFNTFAKANPTGFHPFQGESFAWDVMRSSPSVNAVPYDTRILLERIYAEQALFINQNAQVLTTLEVNDTARDPDYYAASLSMTLDLGDIVYSQERLEGLYDTALRELPK